MRNTGAVLTWFRRAISFDAALAAVVVAGVTLMIVPLPTPLLDVLLACNLALSIAVLLVVLYVPSGLHISAFPSLLLITTLLRIGLDVAATRLILLRADAGEVIRSFGRFVVGNNFVVGAVVFLVITIVQFLVIAKGSERVAEVGARFTLDALPGRQLGIDAELRAGAIDAEQARQKRLQLSRESQFYGAMDGAMKFVKGDVIAAILIAAVNIVGGIAIGVGQRDFTFADALRRYGLLTIGNGLVNQVPALVLATAAGLLVRRDARDDAEKALGAELGAQLLGQPRALFFASLFIVALGLVPGLPLVPFSAIGVALFLASRARARYIEAHPTRRPMAEPLIRPVTTAETLQFVPVVIPWSLTLNDSVVPVGARPSDRAPSALAAMQQATPSTAASNPLPNTTRPADDSSSLHPSSNPWHESVLRKATEQVRERIFLELGVPLPECTLRYDASLPPGGLQLHLHEVSCLQFSVPVSTTDTDVAHAVVEQVLPVLRRRAAEFLGMAETQRLLNALERYAPELVRQVVPKAVSVGLLSEVLRRLVEESISVRNLSEILQVLARQSGTERDPLALAESVRAELRRSTTQLLTAGEPRLGVVLLDPSVEEVVRAAITPSSAGAFLALAPSAAQDIVTAVQRALTAAGNGHPQPPVLLTAPDTRRFIRRLIEPKLPDLRVVSPAELMPEIAIETWAVASVQGL